MFGKISKGLVDNKFVLADFTTADLRYRNYDSRRIGLKGGICAGPCGSFVINIGLKGGICDAATITTLRDGVPTAGDSLQKKSH